MYMYVHVHSNYNQSNNEIFDWWLSKFIVETHKCFAQSRVYKQKQRGTGANCNELVCDVSVVRKSSLTGDRMN